jgi:hypothetical protein
MLGALVSGSRFGARDRRALGGGGGQRGQEAPLEPRAEARQVAQAAGFGRPAEVGDRTDAELALEQLRALRPESRDPKEVARSWRRSAITRLTVFSS